MGRGWGRDYERARVTFLVIQRILNMTTIKVQGHARNVSELSSGGQAWRPVLNWFTCLDVKLRPIGLGATLIILANKITRFQPEIHGEPCIFNSKSHNSHISTIHQASAAVISLPNHSS
jgi:hypothetical protein